MTKLTSTRDYIRYYWKWVLALAGIATPLVYCLCNILASSQSTNFDYYHNIITIFGEDGNFHPSGLFVPGNEHILLGAKILYALNVFFFDGRNIPLALSGYVLAAFIASLLYYASRNFFISTEQKLTFSFALSALIFSTQSVHPFIWGMSGTIWFSCILCVVCALFAASKQLLFLSLIFGVFATFCDGAGLAIWPALFFIFYKINKTKSALLLLLATGIATVILFIKFSVHLVQSPGLSIDPASILNTALLFIGNAITNGHELGLWFGGLSAIASISLLWKALWEKETTHIFWDSLILYVLVVAVLIGISRSGFDDISIGLTSRYAPISALLWIALILKVLQFVEFWSIPAVICLLIVSYTSGYKLVKLYRLSKLEFDLSAVSLQLGYPPLDSFELPTIDDQGRQRLIKTYKALKHYPFEAEDAPGCGLILKTLNSEMIKEEPAVEGYYERTETATSPDLQFINGWAFAKDQEIECILAIDENNLVIGAALHGQPRLDVNIALRVPKVNLGWRGVMKKMPLDKISVVIKLKNSPTFYKLKKVPGA